MKPGAVGLLLAASAATAAPAATTGPAGARAVALAQPAEEAQLHLEDQAFGVSVGEPWTARFVLDDPVGRIEAATPTTTTAPSTTTTAPAASTGAPAATGSGPAARVSGTVTVAVRSRIDDRGELARIASGDLTPRTDEVQLDLADVLTVGARDDHVVELSIPLTARPQAGGITVRRPGFYPVTVAVTVAGKELAEHTTMLQVLDDEPSVQPALGIAIAAALSDPGPAPDSARIEAARAELEALVEYGDTTDAPLTLALPPALTTVLADDDALREATRDALAGAELVALPDPTLDPSSAVAVDRRDAFGRAVRDGEDALARALPGVASQRAAWLVRDPLSEAAAASLRTPLGYRMLVLDQQSYEFLPGNIGTFLDASLAVAVDIGNGDTMPAAVVSPLGSLLDPAASDRTPTERAVQILTELLVNRQELGADLRRNAVLAIAGFDLPDAATVAALDRLLEGNPDAHLSAVSALVGATDTMVVGSEPVTLQLPAAAGPDLSERVRRVDLVRVSAESAASMLIDDRQRGEWLRELDRLLSTGFSDDEVFARLDRITTEIDAVRASVQAPEPFTFTLTGRRSTLRVNLRNTAATPRSVIVRAVSSKLQFPAGDQLVRLEPGVTEVTIPVEARANGTSSVEIQLLTPVFAQRIAPPTFLEARVNAITGLGQMITGVAVLLLITWWYSHFRRHRRARLAAMVAIDEYEPGPQISPDAAEATAVPTAPGGDGASLPDP